MGLGAIGGGLWSEGSKEEEKSEQGSGNIVRRMAQSGLSISEKKSRIHTGRVESKEQRKAAMRDFQPFAFVMAEVIKVP